MKTVLIVDDSKVFRKKMRMMLESLEYTVVAEASNGEDAVSMFTETEPDIITMDIEMPVLNGIQAVEKILAQDKDAKILWISTVANQKVVHEARRLCQSVFVAKPLEQEALQSALEKLARLRRAKSEDES